MILDICNVPDILSVMRYVKIVITIIKIVVPILLIISGMIDFIGAVGNADVSDALKKITRKSIAAIIVFLVPTFVNLIIKVLDFKGNYYPCIENATVEGIEAARERVARDYILLAKNTLVTEYYYGAKPYISELKNEAVKEQLTNELESIYKDIEAANKEREERANNSYASTGVYTRSELMDTDEQTVKDMSNDEFIEYVASLARDIYHQYGGVLPSITIAQACLESGYGNSFEPTSHNFYGLMGYPSNKPKVVNLRKFENFYEATYYHYEYFNEYIKVYDDFLVRCKNNDPIGAAEYLSSYAGMEAAYPGKIRSIINTYNLTKYDN